MLLVFFCHSDFSCLLLKFFDSLSLHLCCLHLTSNMQRRYVAKDFRMRACWLTLFQAEYAEHTMTAAGSGHMCAATLIDILFLHAFVRAG